MSIDFIVNKLNSVFDKALRPKAPNISKILIACSFAQRPGLSVIWSVGKIIDKLSKSGFETGDNPDGSPNLTNKFVHAMVDEIYRAIQEDLSIQVSCKPGSISFLGTVDTPAGPLPVNGVNINCPEMGGVAE